MAILSPDEADFGLGLQVLVAGGGACGLTAALAAKDEGAEVVVLERDQAPLGSSSMSLGALCASGSADQARHGVEDNAEIFAEDVRLKTRGQADPALAHLIGAESGRTIDWLDERHGVPLRLDTRWTPAFGHTRMRMHTSPGRSGADLMARLAEACENREIPILTHAQVTDLFAEGNRVIGVRYSRPDGSVEDIACQALILATCGFGANPAMIEQHIPTMAQARYFGWHGNQGDGIRLGASMGGDLADMDAYQGLGLLADPQGVDLNPRFLIEGGIQVNKLGQRFSDELGDVSGQGARVIAQPGGVAWVIYDQRIHQSCEDLPQYRVLRDLGGAHQADSPEALAARLGVEADGLVQSLARIRVGGPDPFGRIFSTPPLAAPFYGVKVTGALFHTQGGLRIDADARVMRPDNAALPNLFAGGGAARGISGRGPSGYLPGAGLCTAITLGRVAGRAAGRSIGGAVRS